MGDPEITFWWTMNLKNKNQPWPSLLTCLLIFLACIAALVSLSLSVYQPDRALPFIHPGTSSRPTFVVQVIRPREGLPLGGLLPPQLFGVDAGLGFDSETMGASQRVEREGIEFKADGWQLNLMFDNEGRVTAETEIVFELIFEESPRKVRCRPGNPVIGACQTHSLENGGGLSGSFDVELPNCEDATTGKKLGWPPRPFILRGSFDRLPASASRVASSAAEDAGDEYQDDEQYR